MGWSLLLDLKLKGEKPGRHTRILLAEVTEDRSLVSRLKWPFCLPQIYWLHEVVVFVWAADLWMMPVTSRLLLCDRHCLVGSRAHTCGSWPSKAASVALIRVRPGTWGEQTCFLQNLIFHFKLPYVPLRPLSPLFSSALRPSSVWELLMCFFGLQNLFYCLSVYLYILQ